MRLELLPDAKMQESHRGCGTPFTSSLLTWNQQDKCLERWTEETRRYYCLRGKVFHSCVCVLRYVVVVANDILVSSMPRVPDPDSTGNDRTAMYST
jgi:hypothetical protein